jgi:hypothetical protein
LGGQIISPKLLPSIPPYHTFCKCRIVYYLNLDDMDNSEEDDEEIVK